MFEGVGLSGPSFVLGAGAALVGMLVLAKGRPGSFWSILGKAAALAALLGFGWLVYRAGRADGDFWASPAAVALIAAAVGAIVPATAFVKSWAEIQLAAQRQQHEIVCQHRRV
jgi:hypothetical protein